MAFITKEWFDVLRFLPRMHFLLKIPVMRAVRCVLNHSRIILKSKAVELSRSKILISYCIVCLK